MAYQTILMNLGLNPQEAKLYLAALTLGKALPKHLAEKAGVKRATLYKLLPGLLEKGLLSETVAGKRRYLAGEDLERYLEKKESDLEESRALLPELRSLHTAERSKPQILFYEGVEGIKKLYFDNLRFRQPILEIVSLENIDPEIEFHSANYYIPQRVKRKIPIKIIVSGKTESGKIKLKNDPALLREVKSIENEFFAVPLDCYIYGENVSFALYRKDSDPVGVIVRSKEIARFMKSLFEMAWRKS